MSDEKPAPYWNSYLAGFGLGLVLLAAYLIAGRGLGSTGAYGSVAAVLASLISPETVKDSAIHMRYLENGIFGSWLVWLTIGSAIGAAFSGWSAGRMEPTIDKGDEISNSQRLGLALIGGIIVGFGAKIARGCTSGQALSGASILSVGGLVFMGAVFLSGYLVAYLVRRVWI